MFLRAYVIFWDVVWRNFIRKRGEEVLGRQKGIRYTIQDTRRWAEKVLLDIVVPLPASLVPTRQAVSGLGWEGGRKLLKGQNALPLDAMRSREDIAVADDGSPAVELLEVG